MHTMKQKGLPATMKCAADKNTLAETSLKTVSTGLSNGKHIGSWTWQASRILDLRNQKENFIATEREGRSPT